VNPLDFLHLAHRIKKSSDEAERRTSISRSYYATYNFLIQSLSVHGVPFDKSGEDHRRLMYYLNRDSRTMKLGGKLRTLRLDRNDADYELGIVIDASKSELACLSADRILSDFRSLRSSDLAGIISSIKSSPPFPK